MPPKSKAIIGGTLIAVLAAALSIPVLSLGSGTLLIIFILGFLSGIIIHQFDLFKPAMILLAISAPFSINSEVSSEMKLNLPFEVLAVALFIALFPKIISTSFLKKLNTLSLLPPIILLFSYGLSTVFSSNLLVSLKFSSVQFLYIFVFYFGGIYLLKNRKINLHQLIYIFSISFTLVSIFAFYKLTQFDFNPVVKRGIFQPFFNDHTIFSAVAAMLIAYSFGRLWFFKCTHFKTVFILISGLSAFVLSGSRGGMLSILALIPLLFILSQVSLQLKLGVSILLIMLGLFLLPDLVKNTNFEEYQSHSTEDSWASMPGSILNTTTDVSNIERLNRWYAGLKMFQVKPLVGHGPGTYQFEYIPFQNPNLKNRLTVEDPYNIPEGSGGTAHAELILLLSENGLLGFIAFVGILLISFWRGFIGNSTTKIALLMLFTYVIHMQVNNFLDTGKFAAFFWLALAVIHCEYEKSKILPRS